MSVQAVTTTGTQVTALSVLQPGEAELDDLVRRAEPVAQGRSLAGAVTDALWTTTLGSVGRSVARVLHVDLGDVMVAGWSTFAELVEAGRRTLGTVDESVVDLAGRDLALRQHPEVQVRWHEEVIVTLPLEVLVEVKVHAAQGIVRDGSLVAVSTGRCEAAVSVQTEWSKIGPRTMVLDPHAVVDLGDGFRLVD